MEPPPCTLACAFSPDGLHLVCSTASGCLHIYSLGDGDSHPVLVASVQAHPPGCAIYSLVFRPCGPGAEALLLSGSDDDIRGWHLRDLLSCTTKSSTSRCVAAPKPLLQLRSPCRSLRRSATSPVSETSALAIDAGTGLLYSASGDGNAYAWDLSTTQCVSTFKGHTDFLHCLAVRPQQQQLATGSEDGMLRLWDVRSTSCIHTIDAEMNLTTVAAKTPAMGPKSGSASGWCGCIAIDESENWLVAGWGGGYLSTIELHTFACIACLPTASAPQAVCFQPGTDSHVISVGAESNLYHWRVTGELQTRAACSSPSVFGLAAQKSAHNPNEHMVVVGGMSAKLDVFTDFSHRAFSMDLPIIGS